MAQMVREKGEELNSLTKQLMLFESRLCKKQNEINVSIKQREVIISRQRRVIRRLQERLAERNKAAKLSSSSDGINNDNDSAVVLDDDDEDDDELTPLRYIFKIISIN